MINEHVILSSPELVLVPYLKPFVPRYHEWMCDPALLAATESEPLSLEEEYENQDSWLHSTDKLTFILLAPVSATQMRAEELAVSLKSSVVPVADAFSDANDASAASALPSSLWTYPGSIVQAGDWISAVVDGDDATLQGPLASPLLKRFAPRIERHLFPLRRTVDPTISGAAPLASRDDKTNTDRDEGAEQREGVMQQPYVMVGDCNLFLLAEDEDDEDMGQEAAKDGAVDWSSPAPSAAPTVKHLAAASLPPSHTFEVEVMVADVGFRRRGLAERAVRMLMQYAIAVCGATRFVAKILDSNTGSIALFTKHLHFTLFKEVKVFHEVHFARSFKTEEERQAWREECGKRCSTQNPSSSSSGDALSNFWCGPLNDELAASLRIYKQLPKGCTLS